MTKEDNMGGLGPYEEPGRASATDGAVLLDGPDGVAVSLTPKAAHVTGERLIAAADEARSQKPATSDAGR